MYYAVYENEDDGERFVVEIEGDVTPIHVILEDALRRGSEHCFC